MKQTRTLRIIQIVMIVYVLLLFPLLHTLPAPSGQTANKPLEWGIVLFVIIDSGIGFYVQKLLLRAPANPEADPKSTPVKRWMAGNLVRLAFAVSASLFGLVEHVLGAPDSVAASLIGFGLILLLVWQPGSPPVEEQ